MLNLQNGCRRLYTKDLITASLAIGKRGRTWGSSAGLRKKPSFKQNEPCPAYTPTYKRQNEPYPRALDNETYRKSEPYPRRLTTHHEQKHNGSHYNKRQNESYPRTLNDETHRKNEPYPRHHEQKHPHTRHPAIQHHRAPPAAEVATPVISEDQVMRYFQDHVSEWRSRPQTHKRLVTYGFPADDANKLLNEYVREVQAGTLNSDPIYDLERFSQPHDGTSIDVIYSTVFFTWASKSEHQECLSDLGVQTSTMRLVQELVQVTTRMFPADEYGLARTTHRKIIMHVGPTNSGKTHHALRALAAAHTGVYAGPLRLLAQEIWQRLNSGQIVPLGMDAQASVNPKGDPQYARLCNMITGEEKKIMHGPVGHMSCTVEMLPFTHKYDVAVIDEIQMLGDGTRGAGWISAVLGVWAKEVHLCGEETAIPLVQSLLAHTGDEIEVRRYERLTPLVVEEESIKGDFTKVRKGDCIVAFNRSGIFGIKKAVEEATGLRCAVVYGRLPPEVRSEQAALFNDPNSGYDVLVGSDAIGMGLNLKIKRIIFSTTSKYDGQGVRSLDVSSVKQIAGRAGRYGLHTEQSDLGGTTTTFFDEDLPYLRHCVATPYKPLSVVRIGYGAEFISNVLSVLPPGTSTYAAFSAPKYIGRLPTYVRYAFDNHLIVACNFLDTVWQNMLILDKVALLYSPIPWRDANTLEILQKIMAQQAECKPIDIVQALQGTGLIEMIDEMENAMRMAEAGLRTRSRADSGSLLRMECLHKVFGFYLWQSFRNPLLYCEPEMVHALKARLERVLNWSLDRMSEQIEGRQGLKAMVRNQVAKHLPKNDPLKLLLTPEGPTDSETLPLL